MLPSVKHCLTEDGSSTLYSSQFDAHYHSTHGALNESTHVFIEHGLSYYCRQKTLNSISILEFGFGTGLNALLSYQYSLLQQVPINYESLEAYPIDQDQVSNLNYSKSIGFKDEFLKMHTCEWNRSINISNHFSLHKKKMVFEDYQPEAIHDIVYFDAFAPTTQSHLWELPILKKCYNSLVKGGILVTFCAKGSFKRSLKSLGFEVERLPGPPGKREMTRAVKI